MGFGNRNLRGVVEYVLRANSEQNMQWPWKSSLLLLIFGVLVVFFSLQSQHGKVIAQEIEAFPMEEEDPCPFSSWFDEKLPGSIPYQIERAADQVEMKFLSQEKQVEERCSRAEERLESIRYAWDKKHFRSAITTLRKSYIYLSQSKSDSDNLENCSELAGEIHQTAQDWCNQITCPENSTLAKTRAQAASMF